MKTFGVHGDCQNKDSPTASIMSKVLKRVLLTFPKPL